MLPCYKISEEYKFNLFFIVKDDGIKKNNAVHFFYLKIKINNFKKN